MEANQPTPALIARGPINGVRSPELGDCDNGADDDGDGFTDGDDPGCQDGNELEGSVDPVA
jgi:hypothetical protein